LTQVLSIAVLFVIAPAAANPPHMQNAGDHPSVIHPPRTRLAPRQVRPDRCTRLVQQPEQRNLAPPIIHARHESGKPARLKPLIEFEPWCPSNLKFAYEFATE
jgi:hypothetical protein